ncbi:MAG: hypothetical protein AAGI70_02770 [Pseudomonadota bacterium]
MTDAAKIREAQLKLSADFVNRLAVNFFAIGVITPVAVLLFGFGPVAATGLEIGLASIGFLVTSGALHYLARHMLRGL